MAKKTFLGIVDYLVSIFLSGLFTLLPLTLTVALFNFSLKLLKSWLAPLHQFEPTFLTHIPYSEIILGIAVIFAFGLVLRLFLLDSLVHWFEGLISKIPLVRPVYAGIKQLVNAFGPGDQLSFKHIVLVEFPRPGMYGLGFLTNEIPAAISPTEHKKFVSVFIPTTPNPTSGFYIIVPESDIITLNITRQEAMAIIISGGIIQPERFMKK